ncbi:DUF4150 domain-containing protein [Reinekea blandensis]|uniref:Uncharacterized protein n=1 Tax=Reinekea blandensis MED297 TaxID=314283 RepID=A4BCY1_9GAMM|nr:DUF4150 domain-containing protein [Reinekea blandensis]EAR10063.1 hypothetical protein MED297_08241 [Reinekea sp. MED297] [Reinekea blandensis MED297]
MSKNSVLINGRTAVHADSGGILNTVDVCLTRIGNSVVPIPYPNVAESKDAANTASTVFINGQPACTKDSTFSKSRGDEPGNKKGVKSGTKGGEASFIMGSSNVFIEGVPAARAMDMMVSNNQNTPPMPLIQDIGLPPLPKSTKASDELESRDGPDGFEWNTEGPITPGTTLEILSDSEDEHSAYSQTLTDGGAS